ncbi:MAG: sensor domain-containing diguanylate cyclase, partial [Legionellaceae bacterium]
YPKEALLGQHLDFLIPEPYRCRHMDQKDPQFSPFIRSLGIDKALFGKTKKGDVFSIEVNISSFATAEGEFAIAMIRDASARMEHIKLVKEKEKTLMKINSKLETEKKNLDVSNKKGLLLTELSEMLVSCKHQDEMLLVISSYVGKILDFSQGVLYLFDALHKYLEAKTTWGHPNPYEQIISPEACWAIRRGVMHESNASDPGVPCDHVKHSKVGFSYICIPITAQNEIFGLMYLEIEAYAEVESIEYHLFINMVSKTIAMAIANISLRDLLRDQSIHDALTGLYNRRFLDEYLTKQLFYSKRQNKPLAVIMLDLDDFKKINDAYGHDVGDIVLEKLGHLMARLTREEDVVCRYGGEEFVCIMQDCSLPLAKKRAEEFRCKIQQMNQGPFPPPVTISVGISLYPQDGTLSTELIEAADKALYVSKKTGKNKVTVYGEIKKP